MYWNKGLTKETDERIKKYSEKMKGKIKSEETKIKLSLAHKGKKLSEEHKNNISKVTIGIKNPFYGKRHTEETKQKMRLKATGRRFSNEIKEKMKISHIGQYHPLLTKEHKEKLRIFHIGMKASKETKEKMRLSHNGENNHFFGKFHSQKVKDRISRITKKRWKEGKIILPKKDTKPEVKIQNFLKHLNIEFFTHQYMHIEHGYQCDILIPSKKIVIECFGDYWHKIPYGNPLDSLRCQELRQAGYKVFVFWEREIKVMELNDLKNKL